MIERRRFSVQGIVQGVGFRPFVYGLATRLGLTGFVSNDSTGVSIEIEGDPLLLKSFEQQLINAPPPLAYIETCESSFLPAQAAQEFVIVASTRLAGQHTLISPDLCICADCLGELFDPNDRRYRYPFINCTNCGPRFTITRDMPYDRPLTTMAAFVMCPTCQAEYENPLDRRFHAQPNACPTCGPQLEFRWATTDQPQIAQIYQEQFTLPGPVLSLPHSLTPSPRHPVRPYRLGATSGRGGWHRGGERDWRLSSGL